MTSKSVSTTLEQEDYDALKALAKEEDRDISGQVRHMLRAQLEAIARISAPLLPPSFDTCRVEGCNQFLPHAHGEPAKTPQDV